MLSSSSGELFQRLKEKVLIKRPILSEILAKRGSKNLYEYAREYINVNLNGPIRKRQGEFLQTFENQLSRQMGPEVAMEATQQLKKHFFVSTADHHGPVCHPFFVNSNLLTAAACLDCEDLHLKYIIVLSCSNVSFDNSSFPRGLIFHSYDHDQVRMQNVSLFPRNVRPCPVFGFRSYTRDDLDRAKKQLIEKVRTGELTRQQTDRIITLVNEVYGTPEVLNCSSFSDQVTKTNFHLWKMFFASSHVSPPSLIYLEQESFVSSLLIEHHLYKDTIIHHILFDPGYDILIENYFENIMGSFSRAGKWGSYLFWALPKGQKYRVQLWKKGNYLVSEDGSYQLELKPELIHKALEEKELFSTTLLDFIVLSFYYGLKCVGGFNQVNYLTFMKNSYIKMNADLGNYRSIEVCARAQTKELSDGLTIAFLECPDKQMVLATGLDLILYGTERTWSQFLDITKKMTFEEALNPLMPEIYRATYPEVEREEQFTSITDRDIIDITGLAKKISACTFLKSS